MGPALADDFSIFSWLDGHAFQPDVLVCYQSGLDTTDIGCCWASPKASAASRPTRDAAYAKCSIQPGHVGCHERTELLEPPSRGWPVP